VARIAIDIDSTLHHYWDTFREIARRRTGVDLPYEQQTDWHVTQIPQEELFAVVLETHEPSVVLAAEPYPGAVETVNGWHDAGHFIHITSHRSTDAHAATEQWLDATGFAYDELYCSYDKVTRCVELGIDVLIDDSPVNLDRAAAAGITPATLRHPWNAGREGVVYGDDWPALRSALHPLITQPFSP
jgi:uncharacterized HAD superfamily protein